jgi:hypothetical protein
MDMLYPTHQCKHYAMGHLDRLTVAVFTVAQCEEQIFRIGHNDIDLSVRIEISLPFCPHLFLYCIPPILPCVGIQAKGLAGDSLQGFSGKVGSRLAA